MGTIYSGSLEEDFMTDYSFITGFFPFFRGYNRDRGFSVKMPGIPGDNSGHFIHFCQPDDLCIFISGWWKNHIKYGIKTCGPDRDWDVCGGTSRWIKPCWSGLNIRYDRHIIANTADITDDNFDLLICSTISIDLRIMRDYSPIPHRDMHLESGS